MVYWNLWHSLRELFQSILFLIIYSDKGVLSICDLNSVNKSVTWTIQKIQLIHIKVLTSMVAFLWSIWEFRHLSYNINISWMFLYPESCQMLFFHKGKLFLFVIWQFYIHFHYELVSFSPRSLLWSYHSSQDPSSQQVPLLVFSGIVTDSLFLLW